MYSSLCLARAARLCTVLLFAFTAHTCLSQQAGAAPPAPTATAQTASVVIVLDNSAKAKSSLNELERGVADITKQFGSDNEIALMTAGGQPTLAQEFTGDSELISNALKAVRPVGTTDLYSAISQAVRHLNSDAANDRTAVVAFVRDLNAENAPSARVAQLESENKEKPVPVYIVSLRRGDWAVQDEVQRVAVMSGGGVYAPANPNDFPVIARTVASRLGISQPAPDANASARVSARPLRDYSGVLVREVPVAQSKDTTEMAGGENLLFQRMLVSRLQRAKLFPSVRQGGVVSDDSDHANDPTASQGKELELLASVVGFRRGNRAERQFAPAFGGAAKMRVQVILRDRATKEILGSFVEQGSHRSGFLGGTDEKVQAEAMMEVSNRIVARLKRMKDSR